MAPPNYPSIMPRPPITAAVIMGGEQVSLVLTQLAVLAVLNTIQVLALLVA